MIKSYVLNNLWNEDRFKSGLWVTIAMAQLGIGFRFTFNSFCAVNFFVNTQPFLKQHHCFL